MFGVCLRRCLLYPSATVINNNCRNGLLPSVLPSKSFCAAASCWPPPAVSPIMRSRRKWAANRHTVRLWRKRAAQEGLKSLWQIAPGRGRKPTYGPEKIQEIIDTTLQSKPKGRTQWSCRSLAQRLGVSKSTVNNIGAAII